MLLYIFFFILILLLLLPTMLLSLVSGILSLFGLKMGRTDKNKGTRTKWENTSGNKSESSEIREYANSKGITFPFKSVREFEST